MAEYLLGIEWSASQIILAGLKKEGKLYKLFLIDRLPNTSSLPEEINPIIRQWVEKHFPKDSKISAVLTLPESSIFLKVLDLPKAKDKELSEAIFWEVSSLASNSPTEAIVQWKKISENEKTVRVAAMVTRNQVAEDILESLTGTDIKIVAIEPSSLAFSRIVKAKLEKVTLLVHAEDEETNFVVLNHGLPVFSSSSAIPLSGMKTNRRRLNQEIKASLATSAKQVMTFWEEKEKGGVEQIILTGEGVKYSGLAVSINRFAHIPALIGKIKTFLSFSPAHFSGEILSRYLIPLGAAVRLIPTDGKVEELNLFPQAEKQKTEKEVVRQSRLEKIWVLNKVNLAFITTGLVLLVALRLLSFSYSKEIDQTKRFVDNHPAQKDIPQILATNNLLDKIDQLMLNQKDTGNRLRLIAQQTPINIRFTSLKLTSSPKEQWEIGGTGDRNDILAFYEKLGVDSGAKVVSMPYSNLQKEINTDFTILLTW